MGLAPFAPRDRIIRTLMRRLHRNTDGVAALEFAMIAPIMLLLFVGSVEFSQAITIDRRVAQVASSTADLVAREKSTTAANVAGIMQIIEHLMRPYDPARLKVTVLNVVADINDATVTTVCWSYNHNGGAVTKVNGEPYPLPAGLVERGKSVVVAEVTYDYAVSGGDADFQPRIFSYFLEAVFPLQEKFFLQPRLSSYVEYDGIKCTA
jgi:Flp pilus assembly protein TadG